MEVILVVVLLSCSVCGRTCMMLNLSRGSFFAGIQCQINVIRLVMENWLGTQFHSDHSFVTSITLDGLRMKKTAVTAYIFACVRACVCVWIVL